MPLTLTDNAAGAVKDLVSSTPELNGVRIAANESQGQAVFELLGVAEPVEGDEVVEEQGALVFMEPVVAEALEDKVLDARVGADDTVSFLLVES